MPATEAPTPETKEIAVFWTRRGATCADCGEEIPRGGWLTVKDDQAFCLSCADLDHLVFLPRGDAALTRRARKYSQLSAVVLEWARARKRFERQGLLVEEAALERAEAECLADAEVREQRRLRNAARLQGLDQEYVARFAARIREIYPHCPPGTETAIARHACRKHSGRVGRSAAAKELDAEAVRLAVRAHIRHAHTRYDELLMSGLDRRLAREEIHDDVLSVEYRWRHGTGESR